MHPAPIPPELQAAAPELGRRFGAILAALAALIARAFFCHPRAAMMLPLCRYFVHTARRFDRLIAHIAAGRLPRKSRPGRTPRPSALPRAAPFPRTHAWLITDLKHEAAFFRHQIEALLAEPASAQLLAAHPAALRLFRPLCHMLALDRPGPPPPPRPSRAKPAREPKPPAPRPSRATREIDPHDRRAPWPWYIPPKRSRA